MVAIRHSFPPFVLTFLIALSFYSIFGFSNASEVSLGYRYERCPVGCGVSGADPRNWTVYYDPSHLKRCGQPLLLDFNINDPLDRTTSNHKIRSCSIQGNDFKTVTSTVSTQSSQARNITLKKTRYDAPVGGIGEILIPAVTVQEYFQSGSISGSPSILFAASGDTTLGFYAGAGIDIQRTAGTVIQAFVNEVHSNLVAGGLVIELCGGQYTAFQTMGMIALPNTSDLAQVQNAVLSWAKAECVSGPSNTSQTLDAVVYATTAMTIPKNVTSSHSSSAVPSPSTSVDSLQRRASCSTIQVVFGDGCDTLATRCGITGAAFTTYNSYDSTLCGNLEPGQHVCCSSGTLPSYTPSKKSDGSCFSYQIKASDTCNALAAAYDITVAQLESFNSKTWGWRGCDHELWVGTTICLSTGTPPFPAPDTNAVCGPQVVGTKQPASGVDWSSLNPCPLNACCDVWGQCGTTAEFCTDTSLGHPGTAADLTNGCISNCGRGYVFSDPPETFRKIGYFEGYNLKRNCLNMDISQIDTSKYTHLHFAFATLTEDFQVQFGDDLTRFEFKQFKALTGVKRILSIGGWDFSTNPNTYHIFRNMANTANAPTAARNIANFVNDNDLDGVDIDWEYPGAPDIPGIPAGGADEGANYSYFLFLLKAYLGNKSLSIAAPASYWYLKAFQMDTIGSFVDYIVYMTYDLHGQWDYSNVWSDPGCPTGNCLRSHVNLTETNNAMVMITKAGVPSNKVVIGVSSYGRSFQMTKAGCTGPMCTYTGPASGATPGRCSATAGYIGDAEIKEIIATNPNIKQITYDDSYSNILIYNNTQWVSYMDADNKAFRAQLYESLLMGGTSDWAIDLESFHESPNADFDGNNWPLFKAYTAVYDKPYVDGQRTGIWASGKITCGNDVVINPSNHTPKARWDALGCADAWIDAKAIWAKKYRDAGDARFSFAMAEIFGLGINPSCEDLEGSSCEEQKSCTNISKEKAGTGPAGYEVYNSLVNVHRMLFKLSTAIDSVTQEVIGVFDNFMDTFAPIPTPDGRLDMMIDLFTMGFGYTVTPLVKSYIKEFAAFASDADEVATTVQSLVTDSLTIFKDMGVIITNNEFWTPKLQNNFKADMTYVLTGWKEGVTFLNYQLFNGSDASIQMLDTLIANGSMISGSANGTVKKEPDVPKLIESSQLKAKVKKTFFASVVPHLWNASATGAFVIDSGYPCSTENPLDQIIAPEVNATGVCYKDTNTWYYLAATMGEPQYYNPKALKWDWNLLPSPSGATNLGGENWGGLTVEDLVYGAVNSYIGNGKQNWWASANVSNANTIADIGNENIRTAGYISLPVCSVTEARDNWMMNLNKLNWFYPCNDPPPKEENKDEDK